MKKNNTGLRVQTIAAPVSTLGFGLRLVVQTQGCSVRCPGCCSRDSWDESGGRLVSIESIIDWALKHHPILDGLTITGGEASNQTSPVTELIHSAREAYGSSEFDILLFSGLPFAHLEHRFPDLVSACDVISAGPFVENLPPLPLRGSSNKTLHLLADLARHRYADVDHWPTHTMQAVIQKEQLITFGIPSRQGLKRLLELDNHFDPETASWNYSKGGQS